MLWSEEGGESVTGSPSSSTSRRAYARRFVLSMLALVLACGSSSFGQIRDPILAGVIDFHVHSGPDTKPRSVNDLEIARIAKREGMRGLVLKNHFTMTADRAALVMQEVDGLEVFGGVVLNRPVGGLNAEAVRTMVAMEGKRGKVVWLPTTDAEHDRTRMRENTPFVAVVKNGKPVSELTEIFRIIAENDVVLETGHSSPEESLILIPAAKQLGVQRIVVTHAMSSGANLAQMKRMGELGAIIECQYGDVAAIARYADAIKAIGAEHFLISSDLGQPQSPIHTTGMKMFIMRLLDDGITQQQIDLMAKTNPAKLLGLKP